MTYIQDNCYTTFNNNMNYNKEIADIYAQINIVINDAQARVNDDPHAVNAFCILKNKITGNYIYYYEYNNTYLIKKTGSFNNTKHTTQYVSASIMTFTRWLIIDVNNGYKTI